MSLRRILYSLESSQSAVSAVYSPKFLTIFAFRRIACWRCGQEENSISRCQVCQASFDQTKINYFELFGLPVMYDLNSIDVVASYHKLQKQYHPDKHSNDTDLVQEVSKNFSMFVNKAYKTLLSPIDRGVYILKLRNVPLELTSTNDQELLSDVLDIDCAIAKCRKQSGLKIQKKLSSELDKLTNELSKAFKEKDYDGAQKVLVRMRYFQNLMNKLKNKLVDCS